MTAERNCIFNGVVINKDMAAWERLAPIRHRERLLRRMNVAIVQLRMAANYESAAAIAEALEVIRGLPYGRGNGSVAVAATPNYGGKCAITSAAKTK
jgi:hypothetical protein